MSNVIKFPFSVSRRAHARKPRWSKNGTPEERAAQTDSERGQGDDSLRQLVKAVIDEEKLAGGLEEEEDCDSRERVRNERTMHTFLWRSSRLIVESDEADLVRDVGFAVDRAQTKLGQIKRRLKGVQEQAAAQVQLLTTADAKLSAAIVATLLSTRGGNTS
jgi:hypothetical protein